jgi:uncharacterized protein (TIGR02452 family)
MTIINANGEWTMFYDDQHDFEIVVDNQPTVIQMVDNDTLTVAANYKDACCLNFASHKRPGGGYESVRHLRMPIRTQEEDLFRRSNLPELMDIPQVKQYYPLNGAQGFFTPNVLVTLDKELNPIIPFRVSLITVPAVVNPGVVPEKQELVIRRARRIFEIAADQKQRILVLGAWGCGVFANDPHHIANLFKKMLAEEFQGVFQTVLFAIPGKNSHNYQVFEGVFHG